MKYFFTLYIIVFLFSCTQENKDTNTSKNVIIGYVFDSENTVDYNNFNANNFTHINYAFANIINGKVKFKNKSDYSEVSKLLNCKNSSHNLKILISIGDWKWKNLKRTISSKRKRKRLINSIIKLLSTTNVDGINFYWEDTQIDTSTIKQTKYNNIFPRFIKELSNKIKEFSSDNEKQIIITISGGPSNDFLNNSEIENCYKYFDFVSARCYDFYTEKSLTTGHHSNMFSSDSNKINISVKIIINNFLNKGIPSEKLVVGIPFYKRIWTEVDSNNTNGLYQITKNSYTLTNLKLDSMLKKHTLIRYWDEKSKASYYWDNTEMVFISAENSRSIKYKCDYILQNKLAGAMFWQYNRQTETLLKELNYWLNPKTK